MIAFWIETDFLFILRIFFTFAWYLNVTAGLCLIASSRVIIPGSQSRQFVCRSVGSGLVYFLLVVSRFLFVSDDVVCSFHSNVNVFRPLAYLWIDTDPKSYLLCGCIVLWLLISLWRRCLNFQSSVYLMIFRFNCSICVTVISFRYVDAFLDPFTSQLPYIVFFIQRGKVTFYQKSYI